MRSSQKSGRSRGKNNRAHKPQGHSPNRVYESAGPEGKVRGTPQQIIDKYTALARDAQLSGDRVASENFLQHAEHYSRILITAAEAASERRDNQQGQPNPQGQPNQQGGGQQPGQQGAGPHGGHQGGQPGGAQAQGAQAVQPTPVADEAPALAAKPELEVIEQPAADGLGAIDAAQDGSGIVETPESQPKPRTPRPRRPRPTPASGDAPEGDEAPAAVATGDGEKPAKPRARRKAAAKPAADGADAPTSAKPIGEAAE